MENVRSSVGSGKRSRLKRSKYITSLPLLMLCMPVIIYLIIFNYLPIFGVVIGFMDYNPVQGLSSPWVGLENFRFFFESKDAGLIIFRTMGYSMWFHIVLTVCSIFIALMLFEVASKKFLKYIQTTIALPSLISWAIVAYIVYSMLSYDNGMVNTILSNLGFREINWYNTSGYWTAVLTIVRVWQGIGVNCIIYYAALMGLDESLFEAARIDGASRIKQIWHISIPSLIPVMCVMTILEMGNIMSGQLGIFYQVTMDSSALYAATDIINTYTLRTLLTGEMGITAAVGFFQNGVGGILLVTTNLIIKKISPENSMF